MKHIFIAISMLLATLFALPASAACIQIGTVFQPNITKGVDPATVWIKVGTNVFYEFITTDTTFKLLLAVWADQRLQVTGDAAACGATGPVRAGGNIVKIVPLGYASSGVE